MLEINCTTCYFFKYERDDDKRICTKRNCLICDPLQMLIWGEVEIKRPDVFRKQCIDWTNEEEQRILKKNW